MLHTLEDAIAEAGSPVTLLRDSPRRADPGPLTGAEFSNWRDEQRSWRQSAAVFDLSHHMTDIYLGGPDAIRLLSDLSVNSMANFVVGRAKQLVAVNEEGYVIGDAIADYVDTDRINIAGTPAFPNWVQFHAEQGGYDVTWYRDEPTALNPNHHPEIYRLQLNGPAAMDILAKANDGPLPEIKFFQSANLSIGGVAVRALGHNMSRAKGAELQGPWAESFAVREALFAAGAEFGITAVGSRAPTAAAIESGWLPAPLPAVYSGDRMKAYRQWLLDTSFEASGSIGGSYTSDDITDYYLSPSDIGYGKLVKFDHDFIGREALEGTLEAPARRKVTLVWNTDDVMRVMRSGYEPGLPFKAMDLPLIQYSTWQFDAVLASDRPVGVSTLAGYSYNERQMCSLAVVDASLEDGSEVVVVWGEPHGGSAKPQVERHVLTEIRAVVAKVPYSDVHHK